MDGKYIAVGHAIAETDDNQPFAEPVKIPGRPEEGWGRDVQAALVDLGAEPTSPGWLVLSHYR